MDFSTVDSSKQPIKAAHEYTIAELLVMALIETKKNIDICNTYAKIMNLPQSPMPNVVFCLRGQTAGTATTNRRAGTAEIELNEGLMRCNPKRFIERTIPHEVAHIAANYMWNKNCHHGAEWKFVMGKILGKEVSIYHTMDVHEAKETMKDLYKR